MRINNVIFTSPKKQFIHATFYITLLYFDAFTKIILIYVAFASIINTQKSWMLEQRLPGQSCWQDALGTG